MNRKIRGGHSPRKAQGLRPCETIHFTIAAKSRPQPIIFEGDHLRRQKIDDTKSIVYGGAVGIGASAHLKRHGRLTDGPR